MAEIVAVLLPAIGDVRRVPAARARALRSGLVGLIPPTA
jgi:hypothetical protein